MIEAPPAPSPPRRARGRRVALAVILLILLAVGAAAAWASWASGGGAAGEPVRVIIPEGANANEIAAILADHDVVRSSFLFRIVVRFRGVGGELKPGAYDLRTNLGVSGAIDALLEGVPLKVFRFTIPEGKTVVEIADIVARATPIKRAAFLREARSGEHVPDLLPEGVTSLEGLLFPKTYEIVEESTAADVVSLLVSQFEAETASLDFRKARRLGVTPYDIVIIASLIEREAKVDDERPLVASVIYNRLERPMRLEIDATIQYEYILRTGEPKYPLTFDDYELDWPYNTYQIDGLPPGPIASPGLASLRAALNPADTDYYFYKLSSDGREHCFGGIGGHGTAECANP